MKPTAKERMQFTAVLAREYPQHADIDLVAQRLMSLGQTYGRIQESYCNDDLRGTAERKREEKEQSIEREVKGLCDTLPGCMPIFGGDPRGATIKLKVPSGYTDDWGKVGVCVPGS